MVRNEPPAAAKKILIVDDESQARRLLRNILEAAGYDCTLAADAPQGRSCLAEQHFDLLLLAARVDRSLYSQIEGRCVFLQR